MRSRVFHSMNLKCCKESLQGYHISSLKERRSKTEGARKQKAQGDIIAQNDEKIDGD